MAIVNIKGIEKSKVLKALYDNSKPLGMGFLHFDPKPMELSQAESILIDTTYFDYLFGRVIKVDLTKEESFESRLYDRDNGNGAAQRAIDNIIMEE